MDDDGIKTYRIKFVEFLREGFAYVAANILVRRADDFRIRVIARIFVELFNLCSCAKDATQ